MRPAPRQLLGRGAAALLIALAGLVTALTTSAAANPTLNGWGYAIADDGDPAYSLGTPLFARLRPKAFRFQVPYDAANYADEMDRARRIIFTARFNGVEHITVSFRGGKQNPTARPHPDYYGEMVGRFIDEFDPVVNLWGPANEPNEGVGWLQGAHSGGPELLAEYYLKLRAILESRGWQDQLMSPEFHDRYSGDALYKDGLHAGDTRSAVRHYIDHYVAAGGRFGHWVGWHPYAGVRRRSTASTLDVLAGTPSNTNMVISEVGSYIWHPDRPDLQQTESAQTQQVDFLANTLGNISQRIHRIHYYHMRAVPSLAHQDIALLRADGTRRWSWIIWCMRSHGGQAHADCTAP